MSLHRIQRQISDESRAVRRLWVYMLLSKRWYLGTRCHRSPRGAQWATMLLKGRCRIERRHKCHLTTYTINSEVAFDRRSPLSQHTRCENLSAAGVLPSVFASWSLSPLRRNLRGGYLALLLRISWILRLFEECCMDRLLEQALMQDFMVEAD